MTYARARLWLGISGVGTWVLAALAGLSWQWGSLLDTLPIAGALAMVVGTHLVVQLPFDWLGGVRLPAQFGRPTVTWTRLLRGVGLQAITWWTASLAIYVAGHAAGIGGALAVLMAGMVTLIAIQGALARLVGGWKVAVDPKGAWLAGSTDPAFVGGWVGLGAWRRLVMPAWWSPAMRSVQQQRRQEVLRSGARTFGLLVAVAYNGVGFAASFALAPGAGFGSPGEYLHLLLGFTLWQFVGLLTLPSVSRGAVFLADRLVEQRGLAWQETAKALDQLQDDEPSRSPWVERIFHPVPSLQSRLRKPSAGWGAWQAARLALYLSWMVPGLLARAVHCNAGRPELWVLFPGD
ncbi:MAG: hypothetical protein MUF01_10225 [Bryobacterales bacterium]|nr:hypothetical protein [Bryobacterales bacterium]